METNQLLDQLVANHKLLMQRKYVPHEKQKLLHQDTHRYKVIRCGRRFGKTVFAVNKIIESAVLKRGDYWFVAPTYRQAESIAWRQLLKYLPQELIAKKNETKLSLQLTNGSLITLKGADNPDSLRGVGLDGIVLDEYAFTDPYAWTVISPILQDRKGWAIFISTPDGYNHFYKLYLQELEDQDFKSFHFTSYDNPHLDPLELDKEKGRMSHERFQQEYMAEFMKRSGAIWSVFNRSVHAVDRRQPDATATIFGSIDFGFATGHPTAVEWHEVKSESVYTFDGFLEEGMNIDKIDEYMKVQTKGLHIAGIFPDPARPDLIEELRRRGWPIMETNKDVELGIAKVDEYMQINLLTNKPRWTISKHLSKHIEQIEQYVWQEVRGDDGTFKQAPKKEKDDACDALRYFIFNYLHQDYSIPKIVGYEDGLGGTQIPIYEF